MKLNTLTGALLCFGTLAKASTYYSNVTLSCTTDSEPETVLASNEEFSGTPTLDILADETELCLPTLDYDFNQFGCQVACPSASAAAANTYLICEDLIEGYHDEFIYCLRCSVELAGFSNALSNAAINRFVECGVSISCETTSSSSLATSIPSTITPTPTPTSSSSVPPLTSETTSIIPITSYTTHSTVSGTVTVTVVEPCETTTVTVVICPVTSDSTTSYSTSTVTEPAVTSTITSKYTSYVTLTSYSTRSTVSGTVTVTIVEPCEVTETLIVEPVTLKDTTVLSTLTLTLDEITRYITRTTFLTSTEVSGLVSTVVVKPSEFTETLVIEAAPSSDTASSSTSTIGTPEITTIPATETKKITSYITLTSYSTYTSASDIVTVTVVEPCEVTQTVVIEAITSSNVVLLSTSTVSSTSSVPVESLTSSGSVESSTSTVSSSEDTTSTPESKVTSYVTITSYLEYISIYGTITQTKSLEVPVTLVVEETSPTGVTVPSVSTASPSEIAYESVPEKLTAASVSESEEITSHITITSYLTQTFVGTSVVSVIPSASSSEAVTPSASLSSLATNATPIGSTATSQNISVPHETTVTQVNGGNRFTASLYTIGIILILIYAI